MILEVRRIGDTQGVEVAINLYITHLLFVDDILLFSNASRNETKALKLILDLFLKATGMCINKEKSSIIPEGFNRTLIIGYSNMIPYCGRDHRC